MNKGVMIGVIVVLFVLVGGGVWYMSQSTSEGSPMTQPTSAVTNTVETTIDEEIIADPATVKEFTVNGASLKFDPAVIKVKKGDTVRITFKNTGEKGIHDFVIDEFDVATSELASGEEEEIEFVVDKTGTFEYYCSVGDHRAMGMVGSLIVE